jgi:hypothetical protein
VFYASVIAKNVVSLCLPQSQVLLKAFVMEIWRHLSMKVSWTLFSKFFGIETVVTFILIAFCVRPLLIVLHKITVCSHILYL